MAYDLCHVKLGCDYERNCVGPFNVITSQIVCIQ